MSSGEVNNLAKKLQQIFAEHGVVLSDEEALEAQITLVDLFLVLIDLDKELKIVRNEHSNNRGTNSTCETK